MLCASLLFLPPRLNLWTLCKWDGRHHPGRCPSSNLAPEKTISRFLRMASSERDVMMAQDSPRNEVWQTSFLNEISEPLSLNILEGPFKGYFYTIWYCDMREGEQNCFSETFQNSAVLQISFWPWFPKWIVGTLQDSVFRLGQGPFLSSKREPMNGMEWAKKEKCSDQRYSNLCLQKWLNMQKLSTPN